MILILLTFNIYIKCTDYQSFCILQARFKLDEEWQKAPIFQQMGCIWRASKSRFVRQILEAKNMEERIKLKPGNVENMKDWRDFLRKKTDSKFKVNKYQIQLYYVIIIIIQCIMPFHLRHKVINSKLLEVFKCHIQ